MSKIKDALFGAADKKSVEEAIESGGGSGGGGGNFVVGSTVVGSTVRLDKTAAEIATAARTQNVVLIMGDDTQFNIMPMSAYQKTSQGNIIVSFSSSSFNAATDSDYPTMG